MDAKREDTTATAGSRTGSENRSDNIRDIRNAISGDMSSNTGSVQQSASKLQSKLSDVSQRFSGAANQAMERSRELAYQVDQKVHTNPWPYIAGIAVSFFVLGMVLGRRQAAD